MTEVQRIGNDGREPFPGLGRVWIGRGVAVQDGSYVAELRWV